MLPLRLALGEDGGPPAAPQHAVADAAEAEGGEDAAAAREDRRLVLRLDEADAVGQCRDDRTVVPAG